MSRTASGQAEAADFQSVRQPSQRTIPVGERRTDARWSSVGPGACHRHANGLTVMPDPVDRLIIGAGYLGRRVARRWQSSGERVAVLTRSPKSAARWQSSGFDAFVGDVVGDLPPLPEARTVLYAVGYDRTSDADKRTVYVDGVRHALERCPGSPRVLYTSSTSVYGGTGGEVIDNNSTPDPKSDGGRICLDAEHVARERSTGPLTVLRLAGLYGPDRTLARQANLSGGTPLSGTGDEFLNLIHVDDAARLVVAMADRPAGTWVASDSHPVRRADYYAELAQLIAAPSPSFSGEPRPGRPLTSRRIDCAITWDFAGLAPAYPDYRSGLAAAVAGSDAGVVGDRPNLPPQSDSG